MEDVAIAYGFNNLPRSSPNKSVTIGQPLLINKLSDIVRYECAMSGWTEVMLLVLCSHDENFAWLNRKDDGKTAVKLANPKTAEYQVVRTSLLPGLLKTIRENRSVRLPVMVTETSDIVKKDETCERRVSALLPPRGSRTNKNTKARNERHWAAAYYGKTSGFEVIHGLLDRVMSMLRTAFITHEEGLDDKAVDYEAKEDPTRPDGYFIEEINEPTFLEGRAAAIYLRLRGGTRRIGEFGVLHPTVLEKFDLR
jgi:phenylalanyl-tRNA synthetase beta chain